MKIQFLILFSLFYSVTADQAQLGQFPWHAYLWMYDGVNYEYCDGALIRTDYALTAAHCIFNKFYAYIRMGSINLMEGSEWYTFIEGDQFFFVYDDYDFTRRFHNNIGLVYMYDGAVLSSNVQPIALPLASDTNLDNVRAKVTGYT